MLMNVTSSYDNNIGSSEYGYGSYGYGDYGYGDYGYGYGDYGYGYGYGYGNYGYGYGYGGSSSIINTTNMFPTLHPSISITVPPSRVILSIVANSSITESSSNNTGKAGFKLITGLILAVAILGGVTTSLLCHRLKTHLKKPLDIQEEPIMATDVILVKEDEL